MNVSYFHHELLLFNIYDCFLVRFTIGMRMAYLLGQSASSKINDENIYYISPNSSETRQVYNWKSYQHLLFKQSETPTCGVYSVSTLIVDLIAVYPVRKASRCHCVSVLSRELSTRDGVILLQWRALSLTTQLQIETIIELKIIRWNNIHQYHLNCYNKHW